MEFIKLSRERTSSTSRGRAPLNANNSNLENRKEKMNPQLWSYFAMRNLNLQSEKKNFENFRFWL